MVIAVGKLFSDNGGEKGVRGENTIRGRLLSIAFFHLKKRKVVLVWGV